MPKPRKSLISLDATPYYHCISRCVRRAFLCGEDLFTGQSFEHRRGWVEQRLLELGHYFAITPCAHAVMSNHVHTVLHIDAAQARRWSTREVIERWHGLFSGTPLSQRYLTGSLTFDAEKKQVIKQAEIWRKRLMSISWFMRCLNEHIARQANQEDRCTGRFWEGRFKCQALLDESALIACMAYVDLNPIRAGIAETPETSDHTSIQMRIKALMNPTPSQPEPHISTQPIQPPELMPFVGNPREDIPKGLTFTLKDYLTLVDWTGRAIRDDKRGAIASTLPSILTRLNIEPEAWLTLATEFEGEFSSFIGRAAQVKRVCEQQGRSWARGIGACRQLFPI